MMPNFIPLLYFVMFVNCNWIDTRWQ